MNRITPSFISQLKDHEIFVFGSNESGIHGAGAAKFAMDKWGAKYGVSEGLCGQTYAIPTKDKYIQNTLPLSKIKKYVDTFIDFAKHNTQYTFLVTEIGCGLAGLRTEQVGPLFSDAIMVENIYLPLSFIKSIK